MIFEEEANDHQPMSKILSLTLFTMQRTVYSIYTYDDQFLVKAVFFLKLS